MSAVLIESDELLTPLDRLLALCDPGSLQVIRSSIEPATPLRGDMPGDGVVAAAGRVAGRPVFCYAQDRSCAGGSLGAAGGWTIVRVLQLAEKARCPVIGFVESAGARIQEGIAALGGYARIFHHIVALHHRVPQISIVGGASAGGGAYAPALTDFVIMTRRAAMFLTGPAVVRAAIGEDVTIDELGGPRVHSRNGVCQLVADDEASAAALARELLAYLPQHAGGSLYPAPPGEAPLATTVGSVVPEDQRRVYDVGDVVGRIADAGSVFELSPRWAKNIMTAFARLEGQPVGVVATQPRCLGGVIDVAAAQKAARFVNTCSAYAVPLVVLVDTSGFMPGTRQEQAGVIHYGATLIRAFSESRVPRLTVVLRKAYGGAYITMNCKDLGAQFAFAWPQAEMGIMAPGPASAVIGRSRFTRDGQPPSEEHLTAEAAARRGYIDEVIEPSSTRARLCWALSILRGGASAPVPEAIGT
ncbi:MAG TPA: carboxyl transferase domain-containing protein [Solirubrobacteraceae bacterium]|nr:carboxyl transferase domain-containing protein [Solirubrobacteraceae bacterium]